MWMGNKLQMQPRELCHPLLQELGIALHLRHTFVIDDTHPSL